MGYASIQDVSVRAGRTYTNAEKQRLQALLEDAAVVIDSYNRNAPKNAKAVVSIRMALRVMGEEDDGLGVPLGATQGSMAAGGYTQSWTISGGGTGELFLSKLDKKLLGAGDRIGARSPLEGMVDGCD